MKKIFALTIFCSAAVVAGAAEAPLWLRDAKISPDGKMIAFTYKGDIFTVPVGGGEAVRITSQPSYETAPVWSPDSRSLAFASDRYGNFDVFTVKADGSDAEWKRLTYNSAAETPEAFSPDGREVLYSASIHDPASSAMFPSGRMAELYAAPVKGGASRQLFPTPATAIAWAPDGKSFLYQDVKGFEDTWRKHHTSSVTRDIWRYTPATGKHEKLIDRPGEDLCPVQIGSDIYFLSERAPQKSLNVYRAPVNDPSKAVAVTDFKTHPVRFLSASADGRLAFTYDGELYTMAPGGKPAKVKVDLKADFPDQLRKISASSSVSGAVASPNGKNVAFIYRGDVYATPVEYATTKQISDTPGAENHVAWGNDSTLYYTSERDGAFAIYRATVGDGPDLPHATIVKEERVLGGDGHEYAKPKLSPDGKTLAFVLDRNILAVMDLKSKKVRRLTDGSTYRQRDMGFTYRWSPDSKWIALEIIDRRHDPYTDIAIINVADGKLTNITNSGYFDSDPKWVLGGKAIAFASERMGMRNHASWGSQNDVFLVFMNQADYNNYRLSKEEREFEKAAAKDSVVRVELNGISDRQIRITPFSTDLVDFEIDDNGRKLYYLSEADGDECFVWQYDLDEGELEMKRKHSGRASFDVTPDRKNIFLFGSSLTKFGDKPKTIKFNAKKTLDPQAERAAMYENMVREERERFYTKDMHGVDWTKLTDHYRRFLPHISNNYDYAEMLSELLGELNVSHTGGRYNGNSGAAASEATATLGAIYDVNTIGGVPVIDEVLEQGPLYGLDPVIAPGTKILAVNGIDVSTEMPLDQLLRDAAGIRTLLTLEKDGKESKVTVRPISRADENKLLYNRWVKRRAADVERLSGGRLGYVHIPSMDDKSFRTVYSELLGKYNDKEGVVVDVRWNGGGRLHEDVEVLLSGKKYFTQEVRGNATCDMPSRRWNKPSVMLIAEPCYSNAHGTPWVYSHQKIGRTVGMPVPGTMTSVNWVRMQDNSLIFGIPVVGYRLADGSVLENQQLEPDLKVANTPEGIAAGTDAQLEAAVKDLLNQIDSKR